MSGPAFARVVADWRALPMPSIDEVSEARQWLAARPDADAPRARWIGAEDRDLDTGEDYCTPCATKVVDKLRTGGVPAFVDGPGGQSDSEGFCAKCECVLDVELTDEGVDSALGITESDPLRVSVLAPGLLSAADAMSHDDDRWRLWLWHVEHMRLADFFSGSRGVEALAAIGGAS